MPEFAEIIAGALREEAERLAVELSTADLRTTVGCVQPYYADGHERKLGSIFGKRVGVESRLSLFWSVVVTDAAVHILTRIFYTQSTLTLRRITRMQLGDPNMVPMFQAVMREILLNDISLRSGVRKESEWDANLSTPLTTWSSPASLIY